VECSALRSTSAAHTEGFLMVSENVRSADESNRFAVVRALVRSGERNARSPADKSYTLFLFAQGH
jgi:hypothetical protein